MITGSILLALTAAASLVFGLVHGDATLYYLSIVASVLSGLSLFAGLRLSHAARLPEDDFDLGPARPRPDSAPAGGADALADEPGEEPLARQASQRIAQLSAEVVVIDGRPRYHLGGCLHLLGRASSRLPVVAAVEFGFTPCADCAPVATLLASAPNA